MSWQALGDAAHDAGLALRGGFHPGPEDGAPEDCGTLVLLGPDEPRFWPLFTASPEYRDGAPDALDRWSKRVIGALATEWAATAVFPYDGPPYAPFLAWARAAGSHPSPVGLLVHGEAGLFISFRGALALPKALDLPPSSASPCPTCADRPCESACPVAALRPGADYDVAACQTHIRSAEGAECLHGGCLVRRACPVSQKFGRLREQSAFHMAAFVKD
ncbi:ferredoxin [Thalassococcus profundi]|uniref:Ferredoxin n=1 Tax=Thalassococcus profundi TaxID=2282382 RepID=A0A369TTD6_9RHOB|nr:ferredoxin [Thalassococcus profundi]RDD66226.1 ferredoxin [Thalassococcus profundi]